MSHDQTAEIIALLTASYAQPVSSLPAAFPKAAKPRKIQAKEAEAASGFQAAPSNRPLIPRQPMPEAGTLTPRDYIVAMRRANSHQDRLRAISGYLGFDGTLSYSANELAANLAAKRALFPSLSSPPADSLVSRAVKGYVQGSFDARARRQGDLQGRLVLAVETLCTLRQQAKVALEQGDAHEASRLALLAQVEEERRVQITSDLQREGF